MEPMLIFLWIISGFIAMAFWEAYIEGAKPWAGAQVGWVLRLGKGYTLTAYHFWVYVMLALFLSLPLVVEGWSSRLFGVLLSAAALGMVLEDFLWFAINPFYGLKRWNSQEVCWYPWFKIGKVEVPLSYLIGAWLALLSWYFLWR